MTTAFALCISLLYVAVACFGYILYLLSSMGYLNLYMYYQYYQSLFTSCAVRRPPRCSHRFMSVIRRSCLLEAWTGVKSINLEIHY